MRIAMVFAFCSQIMLLAGCADRERVYGNIYEGLKTREAIVHPSLEQKPAGKSMSYEEYEAERRKLLENHDRK